MRKKYKMTGCARFFLVMLILAPLAYLGASYYNGEDGIENIKNFLGIGESTEDPVDSETYTGIGDDLREALGDQEKRIKQLVKENDDLKEKLKTAKQEIEHLKGQLEGQ